MAPSMTTENPCETRTIEPCLRTRLLCGSLTHDTTRWHREWRAITSSTHRGIVLWIGADVYPSVNRCRKVSSGLLFKTSSYDASGPGVSVPYVRGLLHSDSDGSTTNSSGGMSLSSCCLRQRMAAAAIRPAVWIQRRYGDEMISVGHACDAMNSPVALACFNPSPYKRREVKKHTHIWERDVSNKHDKGVS